jgi:hypothetical protein
MRTVFLISMLYLLTINIVAQGIEISEYLKKIESGKIEEVRKKLPELKSKHPDDPSVLFLDGILTENGKLSVKLFSSVVNSYPDSKYADAAAYRIYSYYYAIDQLNDADSWLNRLKKDYPSSPYIKVAEKNIPPVEQKKINQTNRENEQTLKSKYTIQAGAFSSKENAEALKNQFISAGYSSEIKEKEVAGTIFKVVYVGKFNSMDEAKKFLKQINSDYSLDGRVVNNN